MSQDEVQQTIKSLSQKLESAVATHNVAKIVELYTVQPRLLPPGGDLPRRSNTSTERWSVEYVRNYWQDIFAITGGAFKYSHHIRDVKFHANEVREIGVYILQMSNNESEIEVGTYLVVWEQENGQWKIGVHVLNSRSHPKWGREDDNS